VNCEICGKEFELTEQDDHLWRNKDICRDCESKIRSGKLIPQLRDGELIGFKEVN